MKKLFSIIAMTLACVMLFVGCTETKKAETKNNSSKQETVTVDYSEFLFTQSWWERDAEHDTETIHFGPDGSFSYSCGCGNPVNDSDACEGYTYDDETKTITLDCFDEIDGMVTVIKIVKCDENELQLDFDGDIRVFTKR